MYKLRRWAQRRARIQNWWIRGGEGVVGEEGADETDERKVFNEDALARGLPVISISTISLSSVLAFMFAFMADGDGRDVRRVRAAELGAGWDWEGGGEGCPVNFEESVRGSRQGVVDTGVECGGRYGGM
jgi:hypothetical protein